MKNGLPTQFIVQLVKFELLKFPLQTYHFIIYLKQIFCFILAYFIFVVRMFSWFFIYIVILHMNTILLYLFIINCFIIDLCFK